MRLRRISLTALLAALTIVPLSAQDVLSRFLKRPADLTTGLSNAGPDVPMLDEEERDAYGHPTPMRSLPRDASGAYTLGHGLYSIDVQSYCLLAGGTAPSRGNGYLAAPLAGPKAPMISTILERSEAFPQIAQEHIQSLLWAILAHASIADLPPAVRDAARQLLTPGQIASLQADVPGRVTLALRDQLLPRLPAFARNLLEVETKMRDALTSAASYRDLARIAVPEGEPEPQPGDRDVEEGRWNLLEGRLVRYLPQVYSKTTIEVMVPEVVSVINDARGRIASMRSADGWAAEVEYDDAIAPLRVSGEPDLLGYAFKKVIARMPVNGQVDSYTIENTGWAFAGHMTGRGVVPSGDAVESYGGPYASGPDDRFGDWQQRYKDLKKARDRSAPLSSKDIDQLTDAKHYGKGIKAALGSDPAGKISWLQEHMTRLGRAAAYIACRLEGGCDDYGVKPYKPGGTAVPGAQGAQRLGLSAR